MKNGMKEKAARKANTVRFTADGLPRNANDWTYEDWRDLHEAFERAKAKVKARHQGESDGNR